MATPCCDVLWILLVQISRGRFAGGGAMTVETSRFTVGLVSSFAFTSSATESARARPSLVTFSSETDRFLGFLCFCCSGLADLSGIGFTWVRARRWEGIVADWMLRSGVICDSSCWGCFVSCRGTFSGDAEANRLDTESLWIKSSMASTAENPSSIMVRRTALDTTKAWAASSIPSPWCSIKWKIYQNAEIKEKEWEICVETNLIMLMNELPMASNANLKILYSTEDLSNSWRNSYWRTALSRKNRRRCLLEAIGNQTLNDNGDAF